MSHKRPRALFEADNHAPYAVFGTPLPEEAESRDDGTYLPIWKQEVRDEEGRKRLHGAFTGGWSAGYFNTVGSKEGWTPSTFISSRTKRQKDGPATATNRAEDYMDEEDLADAAEAQKLQISQTFAGLGSSVQQRTHPADPFGLFRADGDNMGLQLLRRMGWKEGQGIGPKVRRSAQLGLQQNPDAAASDHDMHLFAPENAPTIRFCQKPDRTGLGNQAKRGLQASSWDRDADSDDESVIGIARYGTVFGREVHQIVPDVGRGKPKRPTDAFGVGVLNDTGSDEEDPYDMGPKINYNRTIGGQKKKKIKKPPSAAVNPALSIAPRFVPKTVRTSNILRRCHDGRLPLDGFVLAKTERDASTVWAQYAPPHIPREWKSAKKAPMAAEESFYVSTAQAAKDSTHNPKSRAAILGEKSLPGKSVFDYLSVAARDKLAAASGKTDLPPARGEVPEQTAMSDEERQKWLLDQVPRLERDTALAALSRSAGGPYLDDEPKRRRYRCYLEHQSSPSLPLPDRINGATDEDYLQEMNEFYKCARIFQPMTGFMASRFTPSKASSAKTTAGGEKNTESKPEVKVEDAAEEAARMGMFGHLTRSVEDFYPTRLLCKRFNVRPPPHVRPDDEPDRSSKRNHDQAWTPFTHEEAANSGARSLPTVVVPDAQVSPADPARNQEAVEVNPEKNEAVEGTAANCDVLRTIFGDSDSE